MSTKINITARLNQSDKNIRLKLNNENIIYDRKTTISTGISIQKIWSGKKYFVVEYYSQWEGGNGCCIGKYFVAYEFGIDNSEILRLCDKVWIDPPKKIDEQAEEI